MAVEFEDMAVRILEDDVLYDPMWWSIACDEILIPFDMMAVPRDCEILYPNKTAIGQKAELSGPVPRPEPPKLRVQVAR